MCVECGRNPCHPQCPNAPEPSPVARCGKCGGPMYGGDMQYDGICEECLRGLSVSEWLELFGETLSKVEENTIWSI